MKFPLALLSLLLVAGCGGTAMRARPAHAWERLPAAPIRIDTSLQSVWTGKELIVSGLRAGADGTYTNATEVVAAYDPARRSWRRLLRRRLGRRLRIRPGDELLADARAHAARPRPGRPRRLDRPRAPAARQRDQPGERQAVSGSVRPRGRLRPGR